MSQNYTAPVRSFANSAALNRFRRVTMASAVLAYAGATDRGLGTLNVTTTTDDEVGAVHLWAAEGTRKMIANGAITQFANVYAAASGKVASSGTVKVGIALEAPGADGDVFEVLPVSYADGKLFSAVAASTAVTNTVTETAFDQSFTLPANTLKVGDVIRIRAQVIASAQNSTDTLNVKLKIGSTIIAATGALDVATSDIAWIDMVLVIRTIGAGGTFVAAGTTSIGTPGTATAKIANLASTTIDTTATQAITATATWSVANAGNSCRLDILDITVD